MVASEGGGGVGGRQGHSGTAQAAGGGEGREAAGRGTARLGSAAAAAAVDVSMLFGA